LHGRLFSPWAWGVLLAAYWVGLFILTHTPGYPMPYRPTITDKLGHGVSFALLAMLLAWVVWLASRRMTFTGIVAIGVVVVLYGAFDELTQPFVGRSCDMYDWLADAGGIVLGLMTWACVAFFVQRQRESHSAQ
jgi:VanZ family protein